MSRRHSVVLCVCFLSVAVCALAQLEGSYVLPLEHDAIQYAKLPLADPVWQLQQRLRSGDARLDYDPDYGYLPAILRNLQAPISSQVLVFSKTSFQAARISPHMPRALYFNDRVS